MLPSLRLIRLILIGAPLWLIGLAAPGIGGFLAPLLYLLVLGGLSIRERLQAPGLEQLTLKRLLPARFSFDDDHAITLQLTNHSPHRLFLRVREELPTALETDSVFFSGELPPMGQAEITYSAKAVQRGLHRFGAVVVRLEYGLRLTQRELRLMGPGGKPDEIKIYPRFRGVDDFLLLAKLSQREEALRKARLLRGAGSDFESLRAYVAGEDLRQVDWKASARRGQLISRNRQVERGQQLAILIDAGRLMGGKIGAHSRLEHAMNAAVRLAYVVQKRGDALALACFSNRLEAFMPSIKGSALLPQTLETLYTVQVQPVESDYWQVVSAAMGRLKRRSLVIMFTDVLDVSGSAGLMSNLARAASRHLVLCVVLSEPKVHALTLETPATLGEAYEKAAASDLLRRRRLALEFMRAQGIRVLETDPEHLSITLVRRYLEIRQADLQ